MTATTEPIEYRTAKEIAAGRFELLRVADLRESPLNPRKRYDRNKLADLTESVRRQGIITPLLVRPVQYLVGLGYEIAAGHRRKRAAEEAGLEYVPCIIREMDDRALLEVLTIENLQREDVHPLEEAEGYRELLTMHGYDAATIADKIGKTPAYVHGRLALLDLVPVVRTAFFEDRITIGHAKLIARLDAKRQNEALAACYQRNWRTQRDEMLTVGDFKDWIRENTGRDLACAPFDLTDPKLGAQVCVHCAKAPGVNPLLVDADGDKMCLDPACYDGKLQAHIEAKRAAGLVAISTARSDDRVPDGALHPRMYIEVFTGPDPQDLEEIDSLTSAIAESDGPEESKDLREQLADLQSQMKDQEDCGHSEPAIQIDGYHDIGAVKRICRDLECPVHGRCLRAGQEASAEISGEKTKWKREAEKRQMEEKARAAARCQAVEGIVEYGWIDAVQTDLCDMLVMHFLYKIARTGDLRQLASVVQAELGGKSKNKYGGPAYESMQKTIYAAYSKIDPDRRAEFLVRLFLRDHLQWSGCHTGPDILDEFARRCQIDLKKLEATRLKALKDGAKEKDTKKAAKKAAEKAAPKKSTPKKRGGRPGAE